MRHYLSIFQQSAREYWTSPALSDYQGATYTFGEIATQISKLHACYNIVGVEFGDRIAIAAKNSSHWAISFVSIVAKQAVAVPILADFNPADIANLVNHSDKAALGVKFPSDFRRYLAKWGNLGWDGVEFFGIVDDNPNAKYPNVVRETQYVRENGALPENYVALVNEDGDEYICVDVNQPEGAIVTWDFFARELVDRYYQRPSFVDYLINEFVSQAEDLEEEVGEPIRWPASIDPSVDPYEDAD